MRSLKQQNLLASWMDAKHAPTRISKRQASELLQFKPNVKPLQPQCITLSTPLQKGFDWVLI